MNENSSDEPTESGKRRCPEPEELEQVLSLYHGLVTALVYSSLHTAHWRDDVVQDVFLELVKSAGAANWPSVPVDSDDFRFWLIQFTRYKINNQGRKLTKRENFSLDSEADKGIRRAAEEALGTSLPPDKVFGAKEVGTALQESLDKLSEKQRAAIILFYLEERTREEVAEILGLPEGTVKSQLFWGLKTLRELLRRKLR